MPAHLLARAFGFILVGGVALALGCNGKSPTQPGASSPSIFSVTPPAGRVTGATGVTIGGVGFAAGAKVTFGGMPATILSLNGTSIVATTPSHAPGMVEVVVTNVSGAASTAAGFTFMPALSVASIAPDIGSTVGNTNVVVNGAGFLPGATVTVDGIPVAAAGNLAGTTLSLKTPAHAAGAVAVVVRTADGQSSTLSGAYTFAAPESFDFNGKWFAYLGNGIDFPLSFTVANNALTSLTCYDGIPVPLPLSLPVSQGAVVVSVNGTVIFSARIVDLDKAVGTISAGQCQSQNWSGWKDRSGASQLAASAQVPMARLWTGGPTRIRGWQTTPE